MWLRGKIWTTTNRESHCKNGICLIDCSITIARASSVAPNGISDVGSLSVEDKAAVRLKGNPCSQSGTSVLCKNVGLAGLTSSHNLACQDENDTGKNQLLDDLPSSPHSKSNRKGYK
jgi:hypothetical protein